LRFEKTEERLKKARWLVVACLTLPGLVAGQQAPPETPPDKPPETRSEREREKRSEKDAERKSDEKKEPPRAEESVTQRTVTIGSGPVAYTAVVGTFVLRDSKDEPRANIGYTYYRKRDVADLSQRPITFAYNGGPGSSSVWLHMGALGPRRIVTTDPGATPPAPYRIVDNPESVLDRTDLVMIDPVGTGFSRPVGDAKEKDFWGVDQDIESVSQFIKQFVSEQGRWNSPKYLLGESYGTTRSAGVVDYLQTRENMAFNGVILVSVALDIEAIFAWAGNDRPYALFLPTYAAAAWFHKALPSQPKELNPFLDEVRQYALGAYTTALMKGDTLPDAERRAVAEKLHQYTGLSVDYLEKARLRVREPQFAQELLRDHHVTVGRLDSRFTGVTLDLLSEEAEYDPQSAAISAAYTAALFSYMSQELKFNPRRTYVVSNRDAFPSWDWKHKVGDARIPIPFANTGPDLAHALAYNPNLRVLVMNGIYDMATPFLATEYMVSHLNVEKKLSERVEMKYYEAGHMMYIHEPSRKSFKADVAAFIDRTAGGRR
jgi:carboxypeptidase C (cathepsin A)